MQPGVLEPSTPGFTNQELPLYDTLRSLVTAGLFGYLVLCVLLFFYQRNLIYYPTPSRPLAMNDFILQQGDLELVIRARQTANGPALIYFGGNAEDVHFSLEAFQQSFPNTALYAMNYRGYSGSGGKPTEAGLVEDAVALYDEIRRRHSHITLVGRSLGSGIAVQTAAVRPVDQLVLVTPFDSLKRVAKKQFPIVPVQWLMLDRYESWRYAPNINSPTVLVAAANDEIIPLARSEELLAAFQPGIARLEVLPGLNHNSFIDLSDFVVIPDIAN